ncbi:hypothetical protein BRADI_2g40533v3 [Brachypodium distachyon]|uniref:Uncharacterized protein n=1 Tax=Brachypodium distachyon TaxID=15368 RepID=A0A0Q3J6I2_BRADI|nr:hypothetical protein BRADI_2g40533v3 [Brachypodium distachyon]
MGEGGERDLRCAGTSGWRRGSSWWVASSRRGGASWGGWAAAGEVVEEGGYPPSTGRPPPTRSVNNPLDELLNQVQITTQTQWSIGITEVSWKKRRNTREKKQYRTPSQPRPKPPLPSSSKPPLCVAFFLLFVPALAGAQAPRWQPTVRPMIHMRLLTILPP